MDSRLVFLRPLGLRLTGGTHIIVTERSGKTTNLIIGKMGPSFSEVYVRQPASQDVYLGEGIDSWSVNKDLKEWRDKTIFTQPAEAIRASRIVAMSFCEPRSWTRVLSS